MVYIYLYLISLPLGFLLVSRLIHAKKKYFWYDYAFLFLLPAAAALLLFWSEGKPAVFIFLFWIFFGPLVEAMVGFGYLRVTGRHLWVYERLPLFNKTTSLLAVPFWSFCGLGIWAMYRVFTEWFIKIGIL